MSTRTRRLGLGLLVVFAVLSGGLHTASAPAAPAPHSPKPSPHVLPFATAARPPQRLPSGPQKVVIAEGIDGCDHAYGSLGQCIPWNFPPNVKPADRCGWLHAHGLDNIPIHGRDRHGLDPNHHGKGCER